MQTLHSFVTMGFKNISLIARNKKICTLNLDHLKKLAKVKCLFALRWLRVNVTRFEKPHKIGQAFFTRPHSAPTYGRYATKLTKCAL